MSYSKYFWMLAAPTALMASSAMAEETAMPEQGSATASQSSEPRIVSQPLAAQSPELQLQGADDTLTDDELGELRGGEAMILTNQTLVAVTSGNIINGNYVAGNVSLSDFSLSNFNGLGNVLINTGAQVSLQTGMNVTINVGD